MRDVIAQRGCHQNSHFTDEQTEAHGGQVICLRSFREISGRAKDF